MRRVPFDPDALDGPEADWFIRWQRRARQAANALRAVPPGEQPSFRQTVWADLKAWLLTHVFHGKCA
ncbi:hypothetical protein [Dactylosporangium sp. CA-233914]|uniref:hypothetical protein n=1 Tax=Dactylosporangium sp. CA-233914 TaxID=3239934 RepID=UPI003D92E56D